MIPPQIPIITEATFSVPANGEAGPSRLSDLINQYKAPMWVEEIRISSANLTSSTFFRIFNRTQIKILFGRYAITNEFVPGSVLAPRWPGDGHIVIKLHKPLYITPQDLPVPTVRSETAMTIRFALVGRLADPLPAGAKIWVPDITAFSGAPVSTGQVSKQESNRTALANPFRVPLTVRFMLGYRTFETDTPIAGTANSNPPITVRMSNHLGRPIVRDPVPFTDLFNVRDQAWAVNVQLPFGGYLLANVNVDATAATETQRFAIAMFGYREEAIQWGT
jgi:hypothetical protein